MLRADEKLIAFLELGKGDTRIRDGFDRGNHFVVAVWRAKKASSLRNCVDSVPASSQHRAASSCLGVSPSELHLTLFPQGNP